MEIHNYIIKCEENISKYFPEHNICFLDIETTGLSRKYNQIYLIGLLYFNFKNNSWYLTQLFANHVDEEKTLLDKFNTLISQFDLIVTYNGNSFDLPFIHHRSANYKINSNILNIDTLDIYREIKNNSPYLDLENFKLKTIEKSLGIYREDEYSGKDCIGFYNQYVKSKDVILKDRILKHNHNDLYYLLDVLQIFDVLEDIKKISIDFNGSIIDIIIKEISVKEDIIKISSNIYPVNKILNFGYYEDSFNVYYKDKNNLIIDLEVREGLITPTKKCLFINKTNLPISKSLYDQSQYMVPNNMILLKVENKYEMKNIKNIIKGLILEILK